LFASGALMSALVIFFFFFFGLSPLPPPPLLLILDLTRVSDLMLFSRMKSNDLFAAPPILDAAVDAASASLSEISLMSAPLPLPPGGLYLIAGRSGTSWSGVLGS